MNSLLSHTADICECEVRISNWIWFQLSLHQRSTTPTEMQCSEMHRMEKLNWLTAIESTTRIEPLQYVCWQFIDMYRVDSRALNSSFFFLFQMWTIDVNITHIQSYGSTLFQTCIFSLPIFDNWHTRHPYNENVTECLMWISHFYSRHQMHPIAIREWTNIWLNEKEKHEQTAVNMSSPGWA